MFTHHQDCYCCVITCHFFPPKSLVFACVHMQGLYSVVCCGLWVCVYNNVISSLLISMPHMPGLSRLRLGCIHPESVVKIWINNSWQLPAVCKVADLQDYSSLKWWHIYSAGGPWLFKFPLRSNQWRENSVLKFDTLFRISLWLLKQYFPAVLRFCSFF